MIQEQPATNAELAAILARASSHGQRIAVQGSGTKADWGCPEPVDIVLSTRRLGAIVAHRYGDLTATVEAGAVLADVNRGLARHGQWIPLDPPWADRATLGGIVATNDSGPRRHRFGAPRDLIIGIEIARADGVVAKAGGIVVKNVAGYDLARLMTGSFGCLGVVLSATFKLYPLPEASGTVVVEFPGSPGAAAIEHLAALVAAIRASQLTPSAVEVRTPWQLLVRFESIAPSVDKQCADVVELARRSGGTPRLTKPEREPTVWDTHTDLIWNQPGAVLKVSCLPSDLAATLTWIDRHANGTKVDVCGRAALGALFVRVDGEAAAQAALVSAFREWLRNRASVVVLRASPELRALVDVWGPMGDALPLMRAVKRSLDPEGRLNPGRLPL